MTTKSKTGYIPSIGIECHVQLKTVTKLFAPVSNDARTAAPNTLISHICVGMPGALPVLNKQAVALASRAAFALNTKPQHFSKFDRKHYFYPDLPKGYQITQYEEPIIVGGHVNIVAGAAKKRIGITRAHLEEDAGKNTHPAGKDYSLVDLNRAGTPLLEIVSEPDMSSAAEAKAYACELYLLMKFAGVSDADLFHGNMRFDVNVSLSSEPGKLGTRTETKNLNSFRGVEKAVEYEIKRQTELLEKGSKIVQETRGWDDAKQKTFSQRGKEEAHDYRYMPEPDIPPIVLDNAYIVAAESEMPIMPAEWRHKLEKLGLSTEYIDLLLDAEADDEQYSYVQLIEDNINNTAFAKMLANWLVNVEIPLRREGKASPLLKDAQRADLYSAIGLLSEAGKLSSTAAKSLIAQLLTDGVLPENMERFAQEQGYIQLSDTKELEKIVDEVIAENPQAASDVKDGEMKAIGFLVGQVMRKSLGKANPGLVQTLLKKKLGD